LDGGEREGGERSGGIVSGCERTRNGICDGMDIAAVAWDYALDTGGYLE
jgi:hypothetical protein